MSVHEIIISADYKDENALDVASEGSELLADYLSSSEEHHLYRFHGNNGRLYLRVDESGTLSDVPIIEICFCSRKNEECGIYESIVTLKSAEYEEKSEMMRLMIGYKFQETIEKLKLANVSFESLMNDNKKFSKYLEKIIKEARLINEFKL